ncbi:MAG: phosphatidate cytidylyltransferase [Clostridia bacterium]|nr:phosphatidate cytidylyltransferase [Clostridia bacterium]
MKERIIFGVIGAAAAIAVFLYASSAVVFALVAIIALMAVTEFLKAVSMLGDKSKIKLTVVTYIFFIAIIAAVFRSSVFYGMKSFTVFGAEYGYIMPVILVYIVAAFAVMVLNHKDITFSDVAVSIVGNIYITLSLMHIFLIRILPNGGLYLWLPFIIAWLTDTFAYFTGVLIGRHKLIPAVSPKKTVEGSIGGVVGAVITVVVYQLICAKMAGLQPDYLRGIAMAVACSVASQFGDLAASCIKREHGIKDFGSIMPGHGGVMDRFDSVIYISPIVFLIINHVGIFG